MRCGLIHEVRVPVLPDMRVEMLTRQLRYQETADPQMLDMMGLQKKPSAGLKYTRHSLKNTRASLKITRVCLESTRRKLAFLVAL